MTTETEIKDEDLINEENAAEPEKAEEVNADSEPADKAESEAGDEEAGEAEQAEDESSEDTDDGADEAGDGPENEAGEEPEDEADGKNAKRQSRRDKKELAKKDEEIAALTDQYRRALAEFDNYRKRTDKEKAATYGMGVRDVVEKILPVIDSFERGLSQIPEGGEEDPLVQGMQAIYKQFLTVLDGIGVKPIEAVGQPFDPAFHNAVMHVDDEDVPDNTVVEEFQKGYTYKDSVVRYSMVKVAN